MKYRKHSSRDLGFVEFNGKRHYFPGKYNSVESYSAYQKFLRDNGEEPDIPKPGTVRELCIVFLDSAVLRYAKHEYACYRSVCRAWCAHCGEDLISSFGSRRVKWLRQKMVDGGRTRQGVNKTISIIRTIVKWGVSEELVDPSILHALQSIQPLRLGEHGVEDTEERKPVPWSHVRWTIRNVNPLVADMIKIQWLIGCRSKELVRMSTLDIDFETLCWTPGKHKTKWRGKRLSYHLGPMAMRILSRWIPKAIEGIVFSPKHLRPELSLSYSVSGYRQAIMRGIKRAQKKAAEAKKKAGRDVGRNVEHWSPHQMRHSRATEVRRRYGVEASRVSLGLASLDTAQIYAESNETIAKRIAREIG